MRFARIVALAALVVTLSAAKCYGQVSAADVLERYLAVVGGDAAVRSIRSREIIGRVVTPAGEAPMRIVEAAPNRFIRIIDSPAGGRSENGFDGTVAWTRNKRGVQVVEGPPVGMMTRELAIYRPAEMASMYGSLGTPRLDTLEKRAVNVIEARSRDGIVETLYFDRETGLLNGWDVVINETKIHNMLEDYRTVDGIRVPFKVRRSRPDFSWSEVTDTVRHNIPVDESNFAKPAASPK